MGTQQAKSQEKLPADQPPRHVASLDGIRALCCIAVIGHHFGLPGCRAGWIGVEMFFVLSGFLISTLLCREHEQTGQLSLTDFWARRAFRLLPIYWLYAAFLTLALLFAPTGDFHQEGAWTVKLFIASIWAYFVNLAPSHLWTHQLWAAHLWSLAKEEQFYFCWPVVLVLFGRGIAWAWTIPVLIFSIGAGTSSSYIPLGITAGCAVGILFSRHGETRFARIIVSLGARRMFVFACVVLLAILQWRTVHLPDETVRRWASRVIVPIYCVPFALLVANLWYGTSDLIERSLSIRPLTYIGMISYGVYLYHIVLISPVKWSAVWFESRSGIHLRFAVVSAVYLVTVLSVASISYFWIELPLLKVGKRFRPRVGRTSAVKVLRLRSPDKIDATVSEIPEGLLSLAE